MRTFTIGIDIGQRVDHSALCLAEVLEEKIVVRLITKYPLGTPYDILVHTIKQLVDSVRKQGEIISFSVDATGVGAAPAEMIQEACPNITVQPFIFTNKSKRELVGKVKVLHTFGKLRFATRKGDEVYNRALTELLTEMKQVQMKVVREDTTAPELQVFTTGTHDDLFAALALAVKDVSFTNIQTGAYFIQDKTMLPTLEELETRQMPQVIFF